MILFCDNQAVVQMVNNMTSSCKNCMVLVRMLALESVKSNVRIFAKYIRSQDNIASDYLSRMQMSKFFSLKDSWDKIQTPIPQSLTPIEKLWV